MKEVKQETIQSLTDLLAVDNVAREVARDWLKFST